MKDETRFKKAMQQPNPNVRLAKLEMLLLTAIPHSAVWEKAKAEADKLRAAGAKYW